jgi:hypothetical protein
MALTPAQLATLKADIAAKMVVGQPLVAYAGSNPGDPDANTAIANYYKLTASPDYYVWRSSVSRSEVYHATSPAGTNWNWATYKAQSATEQNAWTQMFMGDSGPVGMLNFREGIKAIFTGSAPQTAQRDHCFAAGKRKASNIEKLLAVAVVAPPADTGNNSGANRGLVANPDNLGFEGVLNAVDIEAARTLPA